MQIDKKNGSFRRRHIGRYFYELNNAFKNITVPYVQENGFPEFTEGQLNILGHVHFDKPTPTQELINKLNVSKQAISRMVNQCEKNGFIERLDSDTDNRSKDIVFSQKGFALMKVAEKATSIAEKELSERLGKDKFNELKHILSFACEELDLIKVD